LAISFKKDLNKFLLFFTIAYFLSLLLFACWRIARSGFPQLSELDLIYENGGS